VITFLGVYLLLGVVVQYLAAPLHRRLIHLRRSSKSARLKYAVLSAVFWPIKFMLFDVLVLMAFQLGGGFNGAIDAYHRWEIKKRERKQAARDAELAERERAWREGR
jgi:hypothetical protein